MISIPGFKLNSIAVGCKHVRCFSLSSVSGIIADYLLGECNAEDTIFPKNHYEQVSLSQNQVRLNDEDNINIFDASWDQIIINEKVKNRGDELKNYKSVLDRAKSIFPKILHLQGNPNVIFIGIVCSFVKEDESSQASSRFSHPAADFLCPKLLPYKILKSETSCNVSLRHSYRCRIPSSLSSKGSGDYHNINLNFHDEAAANLWKGQKKVKNDVTVEEEKICSLSFDIQRIFDPRRKYESKIFDDHIKFSKKHLNERIKNLLKELHLSE